MTQRIAPLPITAYTTTTAAGVGKDALLAALRDGKSALRPNDFSVAPLATWIGRVASVEASPLPKALASWECRNNRLAWMGLAGDGFIDAAHAARERYGAAQVALVLGTSTSSVGATEEAYRELDAEGRFPAHNRNPRVHTVHSLAAFVQEALALEGPCLTVSTACSSSAKVFASAERLLRLGLADAAIVGGVDTLCGSVLFGFNALQLVSAEACRPFDAGRDGISIGEAAGFALLERAETANRGVAQLLGYGESSDAHHMSTPHPDGLGAERALDAALARAGVAAADIDYVNLHGTATGKNDEVEAALLARRFPARTHASSTKGITGHTLGAAGIVEAAACLLALETGFMPGTANSTTLDAACGPQIRLGAASGPVRLALSNSFGFGGNNCVLVFGRGAGAPAMTRLSVCIDGIAFWAPTLPGWPVARAAMRGEGGLVDPPAARPAPGLLAPAERRRVPDSVALALEVATTAVREADADADLPSVFTSAHGDLAVNDYMCATLASQPTALSPTRFHNSVHNAAAGYWTIGTSCMAASTALSAFEQSFAAGFLEAATQCVADARPVLLVAFEVPPVGALASVTRSVGMLAAAFVLTPAPGPRTQARVEASLAPQPARATPLRSAAAAALSGSAIADMLPFAEALAFETGERLDLPLSRALALHLLVLPAARP